MSERHAPHLSDADLKHLRGVLTRKRDELAARAATPTQRGIHDRETEQGDVAEDQIEQASALRLAELDAALLVDVERALKKIDDGSYGTSEDSGAPIPLDRLEVIPWARRTSQEEERRAQRNIPR